jgi:hypothetical protein
MPSDIGFERKGWFSQAYLHKIKKEIKLKKSIDFSFRM